MNCRARQITPDLWYVLGCNLAGNCWSVSLEHCRVQIVPLHVVVGQNALVKALKSPKKVDLVGGCCCCWAGALVKLLKSPIGRKLCGSRVPELGSGIGLAGLWSCQVLLTNVGPCMDQL
jgi:hypothetical protein